MANDKETLEMAKHEPSRPVEEVAKEWWNDVKVAWPSDNNDMTRLLAAFYRYAKERGL